ncbi:MAG: G5 domain-containing protein [Defluviitaleaceae bacterium]|nr:G5 domain-containing protein [Defluviitaleaceae bacterium]
MSKKSKTTNKKNNNEKLRGSAGLGSQPLKNMSRGAPPLEPIPLSDIKSPQGSISRKPFDKKPSGARLSKSELNRKEGFDKKIFKKLPERESPGKKIKAEGVKSPHSFREKIKPARKGNILQRIVRKAYQFGLWIAALGIWTGIAATIRQGKGARAAALGAVAVVIIVALGGLLYFLMRDNAFSITVDGEQVAIIRMGSEDVNEELERQAILRIENILGTRILVNEEIEFVPIRVNTRYHQPVDEAILHIGEALTYRVEAVAISVMGTMMTTLRSQYEADRILNSLKEPHLGQGVTFVETGFVEDVQSTVVYIGEEELDDIDTALQILTSTLETAQDYIVVPGDSLGIIASRARMSLHELLLLNPNMDTGTPIHPGDVIRLNVDRPLISVRTVEERRFTTEIEPPVEYIHNPQQRPPHRRTVQHGTLGQATVIEHVIRVNSMEESRIEVERIITLPPRAEIIEVGTG